MAGCYWWPRCWRWRRVGPGCWWSRSRCLRRLVNSLDPEPRPWQCSQSSPPPPHWRWTLVETTQVYTHWHQTQWCEHQHCTKVDKGNILINDIKWYRLVNLRLLYNIHSSSKIYIQNFESVVVTLSLPFIVNFYQICIVCVVWEKCDLINKIPRKQYERNPTDSHNPRINQTYLSDNSPEQEIATIFTTCRLFSSQLSGCLALSCAVPDSWSNMKTWPWQRN